MQQVRILYTMLIALGAALVTGCLNPIVQIDRTPVLVAKWDTTAPRETHVHAPDTLRRYRTAAEHPFRMVFLEEGPRKALAAAWDDSTADQGEKGWCATFRVAGVPDSAVAYIVTKVERAVQPKSSAYRSMFVCSKAANVTTLHTHPPTTCEVVNEKPVCQLGGVDAWQCFASSAPFGNDQETLERLGAPFALLQCDRNAVVAYYPRDPRN